MGVGWSILGGLSRGLTEGRDDLDAKRRQAAIDAENKALRDAQAKRTAAQDRMNALEHLGVLNDQGGYAEDATTASVNQGPLATLLGGGIPREGREMTTTSRRPLTIADLRSGDANIGIDQTQSSGAQAQRGKQSAFQRYAANPNPQTRAAFLSSGGTPAEADEIQAKPTAPPVAAKLPGGFDPTDEGRAASTKYQGGVAAATRTPEKSPEPKIFQGNAPSDEPSFLRYDPATQAMVPVQGGTPKQTLHIESAMNTAAKARLQAAVGEMNNAHNGMAEFEKSLADGTRKISAPAQLLQRVGNAFTHDDPLSQLTQSGALSALNASDPLLARYIRRGLSFAEGESMISQRPSDFRTKMAAFLSTAASGASPEMIHDIQSRRTSILNPLNETVMPGAGSRTGNAPTSSRPSPAQTLWDAAVKLHGQTKVLAEYGPRPPN